MVHPRLKEITDRIIERSAAGRKDYLRRIQTQRTITPQRTNLEYGFAACPAADKQHLATDKQPNRGIITGYNDKLPAYQPYESYPEIIRNIQATAQVTVDVPAMCDGATQGLPAMDLSAFPCDLIAMSVAVGLSHCMFDAAVFLGVCDKIVPERLIGALSLGHLPAIFLPACPMLQALPTLGKPAPVSDLQKAKSPAKNCLLQKAPPATLRAPARSAAQPTPIRC